MALSLGALGFGFWQHYRSPQCDRLRGRWSVALLWGSAVTMAGFLLFPQEIAGALADWMGGTR